jgi:cell division protein FtsB
MKKFVSLCKKIVLIVIAIYAVITFFNQQKILNTYATNSEELDKQIAEANQYQDELNQTKENVNSEEYIEEMAREKLGMYLPNERVYINNE